VSYPIKTTLNLLIVAVAFGILTFKFA